MYIQQQNSIRDAITAAINLADRVRMANIARVVNILQSMVLTDGPRLNLTPSYHVFRMYVPFQDATALPIEIDAGRYVSGQINLPSLDAMAAKARDGHIWLAMTNLDPDKSVELDLANDGVPAKGAQGETLTAERLDEINSFERPNAVPPRLIRAPLKDEKLHFTLPARSVTVVQVPK
ncbi:hypothetical protein KRR38_00210 [Novosphingobium sp. G106]|nr:hypothetical protein [Novosphingobium sp. G106]